VNTDIVAHVSGLPKELIRLIMKMAIILRICEFFPNHRHEGTTVEIAYVIVSRPRLLRSAVKRYRDVYWSPVPSSVFVHPLCLIFVRLIIKIVFPQLSVDFSPFGTADIIRVEIWTTNDFQQLSEAFARLLIAIVPIPISQKERILVGIGMEYISTLMMDRAVTCS
jgi:hypothetical protein